MSRLVKQGQFARCGSRLVRLELPVRSDVRTGAVPEDGKRTPAEESYDPETLLVRARKEAEKILARAREDGFREGYQEGLERARSDAADLLARAKSEAERLVEVARLERDEKLKALKPQLADLVVVVARKLVARELAANADTIHTLVSRALKRVREESRVVIRANPQDAVILEERRRELEMLCAAGRKLAIQEDPALERGGCLIETDRGTVDATIDRQLERVRNTLLDVMWSEAGEGVG